MPASPDARQVRPHLFAGVDGDRGQDARAPQQEEGDDILEVGLHAVLELAGGHLAGLDPLALELVEDALLSELDNVEFAEI